jgi:tetratricopeptide (TPR) repeat protein
MQKTIKILSTLLCLIIALHSAAQNTDEQLANYYVNEGDCEKALPYLEKVYDKSPTKFIFNRYLNCLRDLGDDKEATDLIENQIKIYPDYYEYKVMLGEEYERQGNQRKAENVFEDLIENVSSNPRDIINIQKAFSERGKNELALRILQNGRKELKNNYPLNVQFAKIYGELGETEKMIDEYLGLLDYNPNMISTLKRLMPRMIDFDSPESESFDMLKNNLIKTIQQNPNESTYSELLIWALVQRKNFAAALIQSKALDKRTSKDGREVYEMGKIASQNKDYRTARKSFKYVVELGEQSPYYYAAEQLLLNTRYLEITNNNNYSKEELNETIEEYKTTLARLPKNGKAIPIIKELAFIQAFYADQKEEAKEILNEALEYPRYTDVGRAEIKILLADILVLEGDIWEASLLYMQVEDNLKYESIGEEAKFKNARIFYYDGNFKYAQSQLDVLKESTSKLIANDAMNLSILITDNLGLDSNYTAMEQFAQADLLLEQHKYDSAFQLYDTIIDIFPDHNLKDDILMRKADAYIFKAEWQKAINKLEELVEDHADDILADDALYKLGKIYENQLFDVEKAKSFYFRIMKDYPGSLFSTKARKRYRSLS